MDPRILFVGNSGRGQLQKPTSLPIGDLGGVSFVGYRDYWSVCSIVGASQYGWPYTRYALQGALVPSCTKRATADASFYFPFACDPQLISLFSFVRSFFISPRSSLLLPPLINHFLSLIIVFLYFFIRRDTKSSIFVEFV
ncbi:hypothetical protein ANTRET_LOCUS9307 [Anthophora retusa]